MKHLKKLILYLSCSLILSGCAAMFVPETKDPYEKLAWAQELVNKQDRPLPAERLIREAITIFETENNPVGIADAYTGYAEFFKYPGSPKWEPLYRRDGFLDKTATFDKKYEKTMEYYGKAKQIYLKYNRKDRLTDVSLNIGMMWHFLKKDDLACQAFSDSLENYHSYMAENPNSKAKIPLGFNNYDDCIDKYKKDSNCK
jgi:hypothetical protein